MNGSHLSINAFTDGWFMTHVVSAVATTQMMPTIASAYCAMSIPCAASHATPAPTADWTIVRTIALAAWATCVGVPTGIISVRSLISSPPA